MSTPTSQITGMDRGPMWWDQNPDAESGYYPPDGDPQGYPRPHAWYGHDFLYPERPHAWYGHDVLYPEGPPVTGTPVATPPATGAPAPAAGTNAAAPASGATSPFDLSGLLSGTIFGIPSWIVLAAAAYFLFFKKR